MEPKVKKKVLITGGSGMIGQRVTNMLLEKEYEVFILSRGKAEKNEVRVIHWEPSRGLLDFPEGSHFHYVIHLAGAGIADKRWTDRRKTTIIESRTLSMGLLFDRLKRLKQPPEALISASAAGYYGSVTTEHIFTEDDRPGSDFLAHCCMLWETSTEPFRALGTRVAILRTGVVLSDEGGMLPRLIPPIRYYAGAPMGSGEQYIPWIHLEDICRMYVFCLENNCAGAFNAAAPLPVRQQQLTKEIARQLDKPLWLPRIPAWALKLVLGEMSTAVLEGSRISSEKIREKGFSFRYEKLNDALRSFEF